MFHVFNKAVNLSFTKFKQRQNIFRVFHNTLVWDKSYLIKLFDFTFAKVLRLY
jgi:hypothetical protein